MTKTTQDLPKAKIEPRILFCVNGHICDKADVYCRLCGVKDRRAPTDAELLRAALLKLSIIPYTGYTNSPRFYLDDFRHEYGDDAVRYLEVKDGPQ